VKKNIFLFLLLTGLLTFTYYYEEIGSAKKRESQRVSKTLFQDQNLGELTQINFPFTKIVKKDDGFYTIGKNLPVDPEKLESVLDIFAGVQSVTILDLDQTKVKRSHFFPNESYKFSFEFKNGKISYRLGKKLDYSQDFYMEVSSNGQNKIVVARDTGPNMGIYDPKKMKRDAGKFERLKNVILLSEDAYYNLKPLKRFKGKVKEILVENKRNKRFSLNLKNMNSNPPVIGRLKYNEKAFTTYLNRLKSFECERIYLKWQQSELKDQLSMIWIGPETGEPLYLKLYSKWGDKKGYFLTVTGEKGLFRLKPGKVKDFYANVQDFWLKKALPIKKGEELSLLFNDGNKISFKITQGNPFAVKALKGEKKLGQKSFFKLISLLVGQAKRVSKKEDTPYTFEKDLLRISLDDYNLKVFQEKDELLILSEKDQTVFHYKMGQDLPIGVKTSDYLHK